VSIDVLASWAQIISVTGVVLIAIFRYERRLQRRLDKQDTNIEQLTKTLERQFGTNGFVLHERVRSLTELTHVERARLDQHLAAHAEGVDTHE
jgi:membrane protein implicated in regulation of membrane protease activity